MACDPSSDPRRSGADLFIACDFDGTITLSDTVNALLATFALPEWLQIEEQWVAGAFGSRECLARQTDLLRIAPDRLDAYLDAVEIDDGLLDFLDGCRAHGFPVAIVSDGYDWAVRRVLQRAGAGEVPIIANRLVHLGGDRWTVRFPHSAGGCGYGVCKCQAGRGRGLHIHIGDGRSDFCAAERADLVFAKGALLESLTSQGLPCIRFDRFEEIRARLGDLRRLAKEAVQGRTLGSACSRGAPRAP